MSNECNIFMSTLFIPRIKADIVHPMLMDASCQMNKYAQY